MIRIVHLISGLNVGGAERVLADFVRGSDGSHFRHLVVSMMDEGPVGKKLAAAGVEVHSLRMRRGVPSLLGLVRLVRILQRSSACVLQCWMYHANLLGLVAGKLAGIPHIVWGIRCSDVDFASYRRMTRWVVTLCALLSRFPQAIIVNSKAGKRLHIVLGYEESKMEVVPNGFDLELFKPDPVARATVRKDLGLPSDALLIGLIARFDPMKDHATFLKAAKLLDERKPGVHYLLVGSGVCSENQVLSQLVRENRLNGSVHLLGHRDDIARLIGALDIACSSSSGEGFSNALGEAMSCGVPCAVTNVGDSAYIVGTTGQIVPPRNPSALANACADLLAMPEEDRRALGRRARERIASLFNLDRVTKQYEALYKRIATSP